MRAFSRPGDRMPVLLIPTLGPLHILHPRYNAVTVLELAKAFRPQALLLASYGAEDLEASTWRNHNELSLFQLLPWAEQSGVAVTALDNLSGQRRQAEEFREALSLYPRGKEILAGIAVLDQNLRTLLTSPITPESWSNTGFLQGLKDYLEGYKKTFGEGPATGFRQERMESVARRIRETHTSAHPEKAQSNIAVLVDALDYPYLLGLLPESQAPAARQPSEEERQRAILDRAWRLQEEDDWAALLSQLQEVPGPEASYLASQVYLAAGQVEDAFNLMEALVHSNFQQPAYLPGYVLSRYGQLADMQGKRDTALKAYQATLALSWAPPEAREAALAGTRSPFGLPGPDKGDHPAQ